MDRRNGNMGCVGDRFLWQGKGGVQSPSQLDHRLAEIEDRQPLQSRQALARGLRIPGGSLIQHKL